MASPIDDSRILKSFLPSLFHIASVKVAILLYTEFDYEALKTAFEEIQHKTSTASSEDSEENQMTQSREKKSLLFIPAHLRKAVWKAIVGIEVSVFVWYQQLRIEQIVTVYFRHNGTVDRMKTAQHLVLNKNIDIEKRFEVACNYCLENSIKVLWSEMEVEEKEYFETAELSMAPLWINRMRYGSEVPFPQAVLNYIESLEYIPVPLPRFSSFFPFLKTNDRQKVLTYSPYMNCDDLQFCVYELTKEEEKQLLETDAYSVIVLYLQWPLVDLFLQTVERMWKFVDAETFHDLIEDFTSVLRGEPLFDYCTLFGAFWERTPNHLKDIGNESPVWRNTIDSFLNEMQRKKILNSNVNSNKIISIYNL